MREHADRNHHNAAGPLRYCHRMLAGEVCLPKLCLLNYDCTCCAFDQWLESVDTLTVTVRTGKNEACYNLAA